MIARASLVFIPIFLFAQDQVSPDVDRELRARVDGLYRNFLATSFSPRKAEGFVAEDTKDYFYNGLKIKFESYQIGKITYSDNFTKAVVAVVGREEKLIAGQKVMMDSPQDTRWKIENGKWVWYYDPADYCLTPMCGKAPPPPTGETAAAKPIKDTSPEGIRTAGLAVLQQQPMGLDKTSVTFSADKESSIEVNFNNGADGEIEIALDAPAVRGLTSKLDKASVPGHGSAVLSLHYNPADKSGPKDVWEPKGIIPFRVIAAPFGRIFTLYVQFTPVK